MSVFLHLKIYLLHCFKLSQVKSSIFSDEWIAFHFIYLFIYLFIEHQVDAVTVINFIYLYLFLFFPIYFY